MAGGGCVPVHIEVRRGGQLENRQNSPDVRRGDGLSALKTYMKDYEALVPEDSRRRMDPSDETTGVTDAGMDGLLPLGRLEGSRIIQILSAFNCRSLSRILVRS